MNIIPRPNYAIENEGVFEFSGNLPVVLGINVYEKTGKLLANYLQKEIGVAAPLQALGAKNPPAINLAVASAGESGLFEGNDESYELTVTTSGISISGETNTGVVRGIQTLRQLMHASSNGVACSVPCCEIKDSPRFKWRGLHLDVSRHFFRVEEVCAYIDALALHRMNVCHLHLTDDQGWRIEIKKYPKLTGIGSKRDATLIGHHAEKPHRYDDVPYGGFYTQEEIKKIVGFASERHVTVVPEIDMPGHMQAAISAYPEWGCTNEQVEVRRHWDISQHILNTEESTLDAIKDILDEVVDLFPSSYIHIGGDEAVKNHWEESRRSQELMFERGLKSEDELQSWYIRQLDQYLTSKGRRLVGWDEILEGGLADDAAVMCWKDPDRGVKAALMGHEVVMAPHDWLYFDHCQVEPAAEEPLNIGGMTPLDRVYAFNPIPKEIPDDKRHYIIGAQGQLWTEYMPTMDHVMYMAYPRAAALAEVLWTEDENRNITDFLKRLALHRSLLVALGINAHPRP